IEDITDILQTVFVIFLRLVRFTWPFAIADLVFQAYPEFTAGNMLRRQRQVAGTEWVKLTNGIHDGVHHAHRGIRPKILGAVFDVFSGWENTWKSFVFDNNPRIGLIILQ